MIFVKKFWKLRLKELRCCRRLRRGNGECMITLSLYAVSVRNEWLIKQLTSWMVQRLWSAFSGIM